MNTPIYLKTDTKMEWPKDRFFYLVTSDGFFKCRNTDFFRSCVPVKEGPKELAGQESFLNLNYPKIPKAMVERVVGFFRLVAEKQNSEAAAIFVWNRVSQQVELIIPDQMAVNGAPSQWSPNGYPMDVKYEIPPLQPEQVYMGDIHCHVEGSAYASGMDELDEKHRPGIHIVVGKIDLTNPEFYCDVVVDGERFSVNNLSLVWEGFDKMDTASVPGWWLDKVKVETKTYSTFTSNWSLTPKEATAEDKRIISGMLSKVLKRGTCPSSHQLQQNLFNGTKNASFAYCGLRADKFIEAWSKIKGHHENLTGKE